MAIIRWDETIPTKDGGTMLAGDPLEPDGSITPSVTVFLREIGDDGTWQLAWLLGVGPDVTLPIAEAFLARVARFIEDEPVDP